MGGKQGGIFQEWFKNISLLIFLQSFHAVFLSFIVQIISEITNIESSTDRIFDLSASKSEGILAIITIVSITSLIKMEKLIKGIFGIQDSKFLGGIGDNISKSMAAVGSAMSMAKRTAEPFKEAAKAKERKTRASANIMDAKNRERVATKELETFRNNGRGTMSEVEYQRKLAKHEDKVEAAKKDIKDNQKEYNEASNAYDYAHKNAYLRAASTGAAGAFAFGATENMSSAVTVANLVDMPLDAIGDRYAKRTVYGKASKNLAESIDKERRTMAEDEVSTEVARRTDATRLARAIDPSMETADPEKFRQRVETFAGALEEGRGTKYDHVVNLMESRGIDRCDPSTIDRTADIFVAKVEEKMKDADFTSRADKQLSSSYKAKLELDMKLPVDIQTTITREITEVAQNWSHDNLAENRDGRRYAKDVAKNGVRYKDSRVDDI